MGFMFVDRCTCLFTSNQLSIYDDHNILNIMSTAATRKELSHDRILDVASRAIRRSGYRGLGVADIMKEAGLTHGGFYAHFASRDALMVEAMQRASQDNRAALSEAMDRWMAKGSSRFASLISAYLHDSNLDRPEQGCVVAALASEMTRQDDAVREEAQRRVADLVALVEASLPTGTEPGQAAVVAATMVGALQLARTLGGQAGLALLAQTRQVLIQRHDRLS